MTVDNRVRVVQYFVKALSTGERTALERLEPFLAADVVYDTSSQPGVPPIGRDRFVGRDAVRERLSGIWPSTPFYARLGWSAPDDDGNGGLRVHTSGAVTITFAFATDGTLTSAVLEGGWGSGAVPPPPVSGQVDEIPLSVKAIINNARMNQTPMVVTYADESGVLHSSFRGSVLVLSPSEVALWARNAEGGLPTAVSTQPHISLVYADMRGAAMITVLGRAHVSDDPEVRRQVYELSPEVEQLHDLERRGAAVVVEVTSLEAFIAGTPISLKR